MNGATFAGALVGLVGVTAGILARAGIWRGRWVDAYRDHGHNGVFGLIPAGLGFILISPAMSCSGPTFEINPVCHTGLVASSVVVGAALWVFALAVYFIRPPNWLKPSWLRQAEANDWNGYVADRPDWVGMAIAVVSVVVLFAAAAAIAASGRWA
jgi:hypothetical protein